MKYGLTPAGKELLPVLAILFVARIAPNKDALFWMLSARVGMLTLCKWLQYKTKNGH